MPTHREKTILTAREVSFPTADQVRNLHGRGTVPGQEQSVSELRTAVENLQEIVSELLMSNQILRMALGNSDESSAFSSPTGSANRSPPHFMQLF